VTTTTESSLKLARSH